jgi:hypothetical protein
MRKLKIAAIFLVSAIALFVLGGYAIDGHVELGTSAKLKAAPATVFATLNSFDGQVTWWTRATEQFVADGKMPPMDIVHSGGPNEGAGMQIEFKTDGEVQEAWKVLASEPPNKIVFEVDFQMFVVERTLLIEPDGEGSKVTWSETTDISNPVMRYMTFMPPDDVIANFDGALVALDKVTAPAE